MIICIGFKERDPREPDEVEVSLVKGFAPNVAEAADRRYGEGMWRLAHVDERSDAQIVLEGR